MSTIDETTIDLKEMDRLSALPSDCLNPDLTFAWLDSALKSYKRVSGHPIEASYSLFLHFIKAEKNFLQRDDQLGFQGNGGSL
jgi:hypothetical protein